MVQIITIWKLEKIKRYREKEDDKQDQKKRKTQINRNRYLSSTVCHNKNLKILRYGAQALEADIKSRRVKVIIVEDSLLHFPQIQILAIQLYLSNVNVQSSILKNTQYKFYLYPYNPEWTDSISNPIPSFSIKINDRYQEPITRPAPSYLAYKTYGPLEKSCLN
ncbi:hypothetical protein ACTFIU_010516 [Dictyostelium citrinum]